MRMLFLAGVICLFELCTFVVFKGLGWLTSPMLDAQAQRWLMIGGFVISHLFLAGLLLGAFRLTMGYLAVLWIGVLAIVFTCLLAFLVNQLSINLGHGLRVIGVLSFMGLLGWSVFNAYMPTTRHLTVRLDKPMPDGVRLAVASDLHLGALFGNRELDLLSDILRREQVDLLLMPGDIMDDDTLAFEAKKMQPHFAKLVSSTTHGAVVSLGNHDLYQTQAYQSIINAITARGAILLDDKTMAMSVHKNGQEIPISLVGRFDDHHAQRLTTQALMASVNTDYPVILLDHRPSQIDENSRLPIDLQVSGHTHNGQVFPANFIVKALNRVGYGHDVINGMTVVVSSGYGFWGVPLRLGSRSEVWIIDVVGRSDVSLPNDKAPR
ncbi:metallophosphoesterase [Moraxella sp.]|uniref:metallophosphoesterase n=1 Tax=Moraxella sp. TaxID=479 RepID=UPI0026DC9FAB|nr:metallophosphoesterase [Moraxella sp.]MDO4894821.1 metallophosphoesterase [Moraxella sp.]